MQPTIGRIVMYNTTEEQRKALKFDTITGNYGNESKQLPAIIVAVWNDTCVNLQVLTDSRHGTMWITSSTQGDGANQWNWPVIPKPETPKL